MDEDHPKESEGEQRVQTLRNRLIALAQWWWDDSTICADVDADGAEKDAGIWLPWRSVLYTDTITDVLWAHCCPWPVRRDERQTLSEKAITWCHQNEAKNGNSSFVVCLPGLVKVFKKLPSSFPFRMQEYICPNVFCDRKTNLPRQIIHYSCKSNLDSCFWSDLGAFSFFPCE